MATSGGSASESSPSEVRGDPTVSAERELAILRDDGFLGVPRTLREYT